jgi:DNA-binding MurR/RpiR family transcriptional regulator
MADTSDYSQVVELLRAEAEAIGKAASRLQATDIDPVIALLANCKGKVVVLGVGKSGIIGQKDCGYDDQQRDRRALSSSLGRVARRLRHRDI